MLTESHFSQGCAILFKSLSPYLISFQITSEMKSSVVRPFSSLIVSSQKPGLVRLCMFLVDSVRGNFVPLEHWRSWRNLQSTRPSQMNREASMILLTSRRTGRERWRSRRLRMHGASRCVGGTRRRCTVVKDTDMLLGTHTEQGCEVCDSFA